MGLNLTASTILDIKFQLDTPRNDICARHPDMPSRPQSLELGQYMSQDNTANTNLSRSPAGWLDFHTKVLVKGHRKILKVYTL